MTGESAPAYREAGGEVVGGTMNLVGSVPVRVTREASEGFVSQVVRLMRQIEERKPPIQLLMDHHLFRASLRSARVYDASVCSGTYPEAARRPTLNTTLSARSRALFTSRVAKRVLYPPGD